MRNHKGITLSPEIIKAIRAHFIPDNPENINRLILMIEDIGSHYVHYKAIDDEGPTRVEARKKPAGISHSL